MPTAAKTPTAMSYVIDTARKSGEQMLDYYLQAAKFSLDVGGAWMSSLSSLPMMKLAPAPTKAAAEQFATAGFAVIDHALKAHKEVSAHALTLMDRPTEAKE